MSISGTRGPKLAVAVLAFCVFSALCISVIACLFAACSPVFSAAAKTSLDFSRTLRIALFTVAEAMGSMLVALIIGGAAAFFCAKRQFMGKRFLLSLSSVPLCVPALLTALGYVTFFGMSGAANKIFMGIFSLTNPPFTFLYSFSGLIIAQGFYNFPLVMSTVSNAWSSLPQEEEESARLLGAGEFRVFRTITFFKILPSIVSASIPVFIYCFFSFMLVLLFGGIGCSTLETEIYQAARSTLDFRTAGFLALTETLLACTITGLYVFQEHKSSRIKGIQISQAKNLEKISGPCERIVFFIFLLLILCFFIFPLGGILFNAFSSRNRFDSSLFCNFRKIFSSREFFNALRGTFSTGFFTALLCTTAGFFYSVLLRNFSGALVLKILPVIPMTISSVVIGFGITILVPRGTVAHLILAQASLSWPFAFRQIFPEISRIPDSTIDAARLLSADPLDRIFRIYIPVCRRGILSAFGFCFAISAGDTTLPLLMSILRFNTLSLYTYRLAGNYRFNEACAAGVILAAICAGIFAVSRNEKKGR